MISIRWTLCSSEIGIFRIEVSPFVSDRPVWYRSVNETPMLQACSFLFVLSDGPADDRYEPNYIRPHRFKAGHSWILKQNLMV
jgi:hypothetical protein